MKWILLTIPIILLIACSNQFTFDLSYDLSNIGTIQEDLDDNYILKELENQGGQAVEEDGYFTKYHVEFQTKEAKTISEHPNIYELAIAKDNAEEIVNNAAYVTTEIRSYIDLEKLDKDINNTWRRAGFIGGVEYVNTTNYGERTVAFKYKVPLVNYSTVMEIKGIAFTQDNLFVYVQTAAVNSSQEFIESLVEKIKDRIILIKESQ